MEISKPSLENSGNESESIMRFDKSLQEFRDLRSQLHYAADYCEATFLNSNEKKMAVENTKEYLCRAVEAVVDHLGCVSTNLNHTISETNQFSEVELRINSLKQRLFSCEQYAYKLALNRVRWSANLPKFHRRYLSTQIASSTKVDEDIRDPNSPATEKTIAKSGFEAEDLPLFLYTYPQKSSLPPNFSKQDSTSPLVLPAPDGLSILSKGSNPTFHFQQISEKHGRYNLFKKSVNNHNIISLIRRIKRTT